LSVKDDSAEMSQRPTRRSAKSAGSEAGGLCPRPCRRCGPGSGVEGWPMAFLTSRTCSPMRRRSFGSKAAAASGDSNSKAATPCGNPARAGMKAITMRDSPSTSALSLTNL
jgi:hypothetical protein